MGAAAVAIIIRRERKLVARFQELGALSPDTAVTHEVVGSDRGIAWRRLIKRAVIRPTSRGTFYLDVPSWDALRSTRRRIAAVMLFIVALLFVSVFLSQGR